MAKKKITKDDGGDDLKLIYADPKDLKEWNKNPRDNDEAAERLAEVIGEHGFIDPIICDQSMTIFAGHTRRKAAISMGLDRVPVIIVDFPDEDHAKAYSLADNKAGEWAEWVERDLAEILAELTLSDKLPDISAATAFSEDEIADLLRKINADGMGDDDDYEVPPIDEIETDIKAGDLFALGDHRLLCGDATVAEDVERLMDGGKADLCLTDPPYGAGIDYDGYDDSQESLSAIIEQFMPIARKISAVVALTPGINNLFKYPKPDWVLCWFYAAGTGRSPWGFNAWQPFMVYGNDPKLAAGEGCHPDGFQCMMSGEDAAENRAINHVCPKPLSVWTRFAERLMSTIGDVIYDPFGGSGTTIIAAEQLGRKCYMLEISPKYCQVIIDRFENLTGQTAQRIDAP